MMLMPIIILLSIGVITALYPEENNITLFGICLSLFFVLFIFITTKNMLYIIDEKWIKENKQTEVIFMFVSTAFTVIAFALFIVLVVKGYEGWF